MSTTETTALDLVKAFIASLEGRDVEGLLASLAPGVVVTIPLSIDGSTDPWFVYRGRDEARLYFENAVSTCSRIAFREKCFTVSGDGRRVYCEAVGDMALPSGERYQNVYVLRYDIEDGRIAAIAEYANPVTVAKLGAGSTVLSLEAVAEASTGDEPGSRDES